MRTLVTGASGFIGSHVVEQLKREGRPVRAAVRSRRSLGALAGLERGVEIVEADVADRTALAEACGGCEVVIHCAAQVKFWVRRSRDMIRANVEGTRNLVAAAKREGVRRVVHVSSACTIARRPMGAALPDESLPISPKEVIGTYARSKLRGERVALGAGADGLDVVVVNPCAPLGRRDVNLTPAGSVVRAFLHGEIPVYSRTGLNVVDVRDVAAGILLAASRGVPGERYVLGGENVTLKELLDRLAAVSGRSGVRVRVPYAVTLIGGALGEVRGRVTGSEPLASWAGVRSARWPHWYSIDKARRALGYDPRPVDEALRLSVEWFRTREGGGGAPLRAAAGAGSEAPGGRSQVLDRTA